MSESETSRRARRGRRRGEQPMVPPAEFTSYYGKPVLNAPVWEPRDIAGYLFLGGLAGASSLLGAGAQLTGRPALERAAKADAFGAACLSMARWSTTWDGPHVSPTCSPARPPPRPRACACWPCHRIRTRRPGTSGCSARAWNLAAFRTMTRGGAYLRAGEALTVLGAAGALTGSRHRLLGQLSGAALLAASAATRWGIFHAGLASARDPKYTVIPQRQRLGHRGSPPPRDGSPAGKQQHERRSDRLCALVPQAGSAAG